jgi:hypothetical protein
MADIYTEFADQNLHRAYPLVDSADGMDLGNSFELPTELISDIYLCAPNLSIVDCSKFYIDYIIARRAFIEISIGYEGLSESLGVFRNISTGGVPLHSVYQFIPSEIQTNDDFAALYIMTGQITIGKPEVLLPHLGQWVFSPDATRITPTRISKGLRNVQYISVNNRIFSGNVQLREGSNLTMDVTEVGDLTIITFNANLLEDIGNVQLNSDADVLSALTNLYGVPVLTINGLFPDAARNFEVAGADCTLVDAVDAGIVITNPCADPCCDGDSELDALNQSIANLNQRYAQLKANTDAIASDVNVLQGRVQGLATEI